MTFIPTFASVIGRSTVRSLLRCPTSDPASLWRLTRSGEDCIGALINGHVPGVTPEHVTGFVAMVSIVKEIGDSQERTLPDGRIVFVAPLEQTYSVAPYGLEYDTPGEAMEWLATEKQALLSDGWTEVSVDSLNDPD